MHRCHLRNRRQSLHHGRRASLIFSSNRGVRLDQARRTRVDDTPLLIRYSKCFIGGPAPCTYGLTRSIESVTVTLLRPASTETQNKQMEST
jgi:hypothetical protein